MSFATHIKKVLGHEGGYVHDPVDPGGETNFGISKASYPRVDIARLTAGEAVEIYRQDYWNRTKIVDLPDSISGAVLDFAVNHGRRRAAIYCQKTINAFGGNVRVDGAIGPITVAAAENLDSSLFLRELTARRLSFYDRIIHNNPPMSKFKNGWYKRANSWLPVVKKPVVKKPTVVKSADKK